MLSAFLAARAQNLKQIKGIAPGGVAQFLWTKADRVKVVRVVQAQFVQKLPDGFLGEALECDHRPQIQATNPLEQRQDVRAGILGVALGEDQLEARVRWVGHQKLHELEGAGVHPL